MSFFNLHHLFEIRQRSIQLVILMVCCLATSQLFAQGRQETIVQTGDAAPDGNGAYSNLTSHFLNNNGQIAFTADLTGTSGGSANTGIFQFGSTGIEQIVRHNDATPTADGNFQSFFLRSQNDAGQVSFVANLFGTSNGLGNNSGIFRSSTSGLTEIVREGDVAPNGSTFEGFNNFTQPILNSSGEVSFFSALANSTSGVYRANGSTTMPIAVTGQASPDGNGTLNGFSIRARINDSGDVLFTSTLAGTSGGFNDDRGLYRSSGGTLTQVVREGQVAPDGNGTFAAIPGGYDINNAGDVAFSASFVGTAGGTSDDVGLYIDNNGTMTQIAREGGIAPNGSTYSTITSGIHFNQNGDVAFSARLVSSSSFNIYRGDINGATEIARFGQSTPNGDGTFGQLSMSRMNDNGAITFRSILIGTAAGTADNQAVYISDGIDLIEVARKGDALDGSTIANFNTFLMPINNFGQATFRVPLADGRTVIQLFTPDLHWRTNTSGNWVDSDNWTLGTPPAHVHDVYIDPASNVTVQGPNANTTVRDLQIGGGTGNAVLNWDTSTQLTANNINVNNNGTLTGGGHFNAQSVTVNNGGMIDNQFDDMTFNSPTFTNHGTVNNNISYTTINGDVLNSSSGLFSAAVESTFEINGDFDNEGNLFLDDSSLAYVSGTYSGEGDFTGQGWLSINGELSPGNSAAAILMDGIVELGPDATSHFELGGDDIGEFDRIFGMDEFFVDGDLLVSLINGFQLETSTQFVIADVEGSRFGQFDGLAEGALVGTYGGQDLFISYNAGDGNDIALFTVPEPTTGLMASLFLLGSMMTRRRRR